MGQSPLLGLSSPGPHGSGVCTLPPKVQQVGRSLGHLTGYPCVCSVLSPSSWRPGTGTMTPLQMVSVPCAGGEWSVEGSCQQDFPQDAGTLVRWARVPVARPVLLCPLEAMAHTSCFGGVRSSPYLWLCRAVCTVPLFPVSSVYSSGAHVGRSSGMG